MLRITLINDEKAAIFKMEGKLMDEWVREAEKAWKDFSDRVPGDRIVVDLCGVSFVDEPGRNLLEQMHAAGARLLGTGPMIGALIDEICGDQRQTGKKWIRHVLGLFFLLPLVLLICNNRTVGAQEVSAAPSLTLEQAISIAQANNRQIKNASLTVALWQRSLLCCSCQSFTPFLTST